jgi:predicted hydrolase (HD superfamily)
MPTETLDYATLPSRADAEALADKYLTDTRRHCAQVGQVMEWFAKDLGLDVDEQHRWYITGLLHDVDWDHIGKDGEKHL